MKKIYLIFANISSHFCSSKLIFFVFMCSSVVCSLSFLYCYGNMIGYIQQRSSQERYWREYQVDLESYDNIEEVMDKLKNINNDYIEDIALCSRLNNSDEATLYASLTESNKWSAKSGRVSFSDAELSDGANRIIVPSTYKSEKSTLNLNNTDYQIIGMHSSYTEYRIPLKNFLENGYRADFATIIASQVPTNEINRLITSEIRSQFPDDYIYTAYLYINAEMKKMPSEVLMLTLMYGISILSFIFLLRYMVEKTYKDLIVYSIVGASKGDLSVFVLIEAFILSSITTLLAILLHSSLYDVVFSKINYADSIYYTFKDYFVTFIINVTVTQIVNLPFIVKLYRRSVTQSKRELIG